MLLAGAAYFLAGLAMLPFLVVHLFGSAMGEGSSFRTPFDQLVADLSLPGLESALLVAWLLLPFAWLALAFALISTRHASSAYAKALRFSGAILGAISTAAYGWETGFLFLPPALLACWHIAMAEHPSPKPAAAVEVSKIVDPE